MSKKVLEESLKEYKQIKDTLKQNAKEILRNTMSEEINGLIKESLEDEEEESELEIGAEDEITSDDTLGTEMDDDQMDIEMDGEEVEDEMVIDVTDDSLDMDSEIDLTNEYDMDKVFNIFKKLKDDDEIEIVSDKTVKLTDEDSGNEYEIRLDENENEEEDVIFEIEMDDEENVEELTLEIEKEDEEEDVIFEIEMEDEEIELCEDGSCETVSEEEKVDLKEHSILKKKYQTILKETKELKSKNNEFRKTLVEFKNLLNDAVLMNSNLAYVTKLFTENTTNFNEKKLIVERFDTEVKTLDDSKKLYKQIKSELSSKQVESKTKINESLQSSNSKSIKLNESTTYVDEGLQKTLDLMRRINK